MTAEGWKQLIVSAVQKNGESLDLLARLLEEQDKATQILRNKGYGWTGLSLLSMVEGLENKSHEWTQRPYRPVYNAMRCCLIRNEP